MIKFYDMKTRDQQMCGFKSYREMFWASFALILLPVIMWVVKIHG